MQGSKFAVAVAGRTFESFKEVDDFRKDLNLKDVIAVFVF